MGIWRTSFLLLENVAPCSGLFKERTRILVCHPDWWMPEIGAFCCQFPYLEVTLSSMDFTGGSDGKESACTAGDLGSLPGLKRSPGGGHGNPLQYSCLQNPHGKRSLVGYSPWGSQRVGHDWATKHTLSAMLELAYMTVESQHVLLCSTVSHDSLESAMMKLFAPRKLANTTIRAVCSFLTSLKEPIIHHLPVYHCY